MAKIDTMTDADIEKLTAKIEELTYANIKLIDESVGYKNIEIRNEGLIVENQQLRQTILSHSGAMQKVGLSIIKMGIQMGIIEHAKGKDGQKP